MKKGKTLTINFYNMQSSIFQISTEPIDQKCYLNENTLEQGESTFWKYCMNIDPDCR